MRSQTIAAGLWASVALVAQGANAQEPIMLDPVILSGGLTAIEEEDYGRAATVITGADIEDRGITSVQDALRAVPGVAISSTGGNFTQVRIRGGEGNHTLILIDGIEAAGGDGEYILSGLETANIDRIEVLRGPQSVFYGSNASAGVINIITRTGGIGREFGASVEYGSYGSASASAFASARNARGGLSFSLSAVKDAGWDFSGDDGERDETSRRTAILKGDWALTEDITLGFNLRRAREEYNYDSNSYAATDADSYVVDDPDQHSERDETTFSVYAEQALLADRAVHRLSYERTDNSQIYNDGTPTDTKTEALKYRLSFGLDGTVESADQLVSLAVERERDSSSSNPAYERETDSVAVEYRASFDSGFDLQAGLRYDDNSVFDDATTWTLAAAYNFANGVRLHASAGTAVVNPSYFELYADAYGYVGNPDLKPERNESFDIGVEVPVFAGRGTVDLTYFRENLRDEITSISTGSGYTFENQSGDSTREGVEIEGRLAATQNVDLRLFYTYLEAKNPDGSVEVRRPRHELGAGVTARMLNDRATLSADLRHVAGNFDTQYFGSYAVAELDAYTMVDVAARYGITDTVDATLRVDNLFDAEHEDAWGYAGRDRAIYVGLDANW